MNINVLIDIQMHPGNHWMCMAQGRLKEISIAELGEPRVHPIGFQMPQGLVVLQNTETLAKLVKKPSIPYSTRVFENTTVDYVS